MASAQLELVRSIFARWERGDFSSSEWADPEIEWVTADGFEPGRVSGLAGMAAGWRGFVSLWKDYSIEAREYRELDDERVLVFYRRSGRGRTSGMKLEELRADGASLFHIRTGKVTRMVSYAEPDRALAELGLAPQVPREEP
jgi:ketosteroid isomerase-like protein